MKTTIILMSIFLSFITQGQEPSLNVFKSYNTKIKAFLQDQSDLDKFLIIYDEAGANKAEIYSASKEKFVESSITLNPVCIQQYMIYADPFLGTASKNCLRDEKKFISISDNQIEGSAFNVNFFKKEGNTLSLLYNGNAADYQEEPKGYLKIKKIDLNTHAIVEETILAEINGAPGAIGFSFDQSKVFLAFYDFESEVNDLLSLDTGEVEAGRPKLRSVKSNLLNWVFKFHPYPEGIIINNGGAEGAAPTLHSYNIEGYLLTEFNYPENCIFAGAFAKKGYFVCDEKNLAYIELNRLKK